MTSIDLQVKPQSGGLFLDVTLTQRCKASRLLVTLHCSAKRSTGFPGYTAVVSACFLLK
jgi:hypothetical protein